MRSSIRTNLKRKSSEPEMETTHPKRIKRKADEPEMEANKPKQKKQIHGVKRKLPVVTGENIENPQKKIKLIKNAKEDKKKKLEFPVWR